MYRFFHLDPQTSRPGAVGPAVAHKKPGEETPEEQEGLELPVNPDQGTPLIPDEEGVVTVPA